jgi:hypothetical protein
MLLEKLSRRVRKRQSVWFPHAMYYQSLQLITFTHLKLILEIKIISLRIVRQLCKFLRICR